MGELEINGWSTGFSYQWMAHAFEVPHRLWCLMMGADACLKESYTPDGISTWVAMPQKFFTWYLESHTLTQAILAVPILSLFATLSALDYVMMENHNQGMAITCFVVAIACLYSQYRVRKMKKCES